MQPILAHHIALTSIDMRAFAPALLCVALATGYFVMSRESSAPPPGPPPEVASRSVADPTTPAHHDSASVPQSAATPTSRVAISPSLMALTFEQHLEDFIRDQFADRPSSDLGHAVSVDTMLRDTTINPDGKLLRDVDRVRLAGILAEFSRREAALEARERPLCRQALLQAVTSGQFEVADGVVASTATAEGVVALQQSIARQREEQAKTMERLSTRLGAPMRDWAFSVLSSVGPDGRGHVTTVYFTRAQAADLFACRDEMSDVVQERRRAAAELIAALPR
jgi:hypothetical protein